MVREIGIFVAGCIIGVSSGALYFKKRYETIANLEIESVKKAYRENDDIAKYCEHDKKVVEELVKHNHEKPPIDEIVKESYANYSRKKAEEQKKQEVVSSFSDEKKEEVREVRNKPYIITPDELGDIQEYDTTTLIYFSDDILMDYDSGEIIPESMIGDYVPVDFMNHFGEFDDEDSVCVRNDKKETDYEILRDEATYNEGTTWGM